MRRLLLLLLLLLVGCSRHAVKAPVLTARTCAKGTCPFPALYKGQVIQMCAILSKPSCTDYDHNVIVDMIPPGISAEQDGDDGPAGDKDDVKGRHWWKLWLK